MKLKKILFLVLAAVVLSAPIAAFSQESSDSTVSSVSNSSDTDVDSEFVYDPWEPFNRKIYWFNDRADRYAFEHVARGYAYVVPDPVEIGVGNLFNNLKYPKRFISSLAMGEVSNAGWETLRFLVNTTLGIGGFFDVADKLNIPETRNDMGLVMASYGIPSGPYLVLPLFGPSNVRDGVGRGLDAVLDPMFWLAFVSGVDAGVADKISWGSWSLYLLDERAGLLDTIEAARENSVDFYLTSQGAYDQYRRGLLASEQQTDEELLDDDYDDF